MQIRFASSGSYSHLCKAYIVNVEYLEGASAALRNFRDVFKRIWSRLSTIIDGVKSHLESLHCKLYTVNFSNFIA